MSSGAGRGALVAPETYRTFLEQPVAGRRDECRRIVLALVDEGVPLRALYEELFQEALYEVGRRWQCGAVSVAVEHVATAITEDLLAAVFPRTLAREGTRRRAVVSCAADEFHQVGGRIVADSLELLGWDVRFLGASMPVNDLTRLVESHRPDLVALSASIADHLPSVTEAIDAVRAVDPEVLVVVGGQAFVEAGAGLAGRHRVRVVTTLGGLEALVREWPVP